MNIYEANIKLIGVGNAMCIAKEALGNKGNFNEVFKKFLPKED